MQAHRKLMLVGGLLLVVTFLINEHHTGADHPGGGFNPAYVTGAVMIGLFLWSFYLFYSKDGGRNAR